MPTGLSNDLATVKQQLVRVYNSSGTFLDVWRDAPLLAGFKEAVNAATTPLQVTLPRAFENYDLAGQPNSRQTIAQGNIVRYYLYGPGLPTTGLLRYQGVIDAFQPQIADSGEESIVVTITPQSSAIADHGVGGGYEFGQAGNATTYVDPITMFNAWFTNIDPITSVPYLFPLTLDPNNPASSGVGATYAFLNQTIQSAFSTILLMLPSNWFYRCNPDNSVTLNVTPTIPQHTFVVGQHITAPTYKQDWTQLKNVIYFKGGQTSSQQSGGSSGSGSSQSQSTIVAIAKGTDLGLFGERLDLVSDTRVVDQNTLTILAKGVLAALDQMQLRTTLRIVDYRGDARASIGYDIETIQVGDSCNIVDPTFILTTTQSPALWDVAHWDVDYWTYVPGSILNQTVIITGLSYGFDYVDLELSSIQPNQDAAIVALRSQFQDYTMGR